MPTWSVNSSPVPTWSVNSGPVSTWASQLITCASAQLSTCADMSTSTQHLCLPEQLKSASVSTWTAQLSTNSTWKEHIWQEPLNSALRSTWKEQLNSSHLCLHENLTQPYLMALLISLCHVRFSNCKIYQWILSKTFSIITSYIVYCPLKSYCLALTCFELLCSFNWHYVIRCTGLFCKCDKVLTVSYI